MKTIFTLLVAAAGCAAFAQAPTDPNEVLIWNAYQKLQSDTSYELDLSGTKVVRSPTSNVTTNFRSSLYFTLSNDPRTGQESLSKVELDNYVYNNSARQWMLTRRAVGDGANLYVYDWTRYQYFSTFYSFYGKVGPANGNSSDAPIMLQQLDASVEGPAAYMVRMLREINQGIAAPSTSRYQTWAPGEVTMQPLTEPPTQDPLVPSRNYSTTSTEQWVLYGPPPLNKPNYYRIPPSRSVAFQIDNKTGDASSPDWELSAVYFAEKTPFSFTDWNIQVSVPITTLSSSLFVPYTLAQLQGWKQLDVTRHYTG